MLKEIPGYGGKYLISETGSVYSPRRQGSKGHYVVQRKNSNGYLRVCLKSIDGQKHELVHRLVAMTYLDKPYGKDFINHKDGNKENNNVSNLEWCTKSENMKHAVKNNLIHYHGLRGEKHHQCKISDADALEIIRLRKSGVLSHILAKQYGVSGTTIRNIVYGRRKFSNETDGDE